MTKARLSKMAYLLVAAFICLGAYAHAGKITVENTTRFEIRMAFKFFDYKKKEWVVCGWYTVPAHTKKSYNFSLAPDRKVYWYGKTPDGKRYWPGTGDHLQAVISKKMDSLKASVIKTYADSKQVNFLSRNPNSEGNLSIKLVSSS